MGASDGLGSLRLKKLMRTGAALGSVGLGVGLYASVYERRAFQVRFESLPLLPVGDRPFRILHLSDIHFVRGQHKKAAWLRSLAALKPDLVINTGDNLSDPRAVPELISALEPLLKVPGVYVGGSNDYYAPTFKNPLIYLLQPSSKNTKRKPPPENPWQALFNAFGSAGWVNLNNRAYADVWGRMRLEFSGVDDPHIKRDYYAGWPAGSSTSDSAPHLKIGVTHAPYRRVLDTFTEHGADLIFAGHTHGGQVCIPGYGALTSNSDLPTWQARGLSSWEYQGREVPLEVSAGIGTSRFAPVRFACKPEAVVVDVVPQV